MTHHHLCAPSLPVLHALPRRGALLHQAVFLENLTPLEAGRLTQRLLKYLLFKVALVGMLVLPSSKVQLLHWLPW